MEKEGLITFKSTHFALRAEKVLEKKGLKFKTIPTPREVSHSCGLSLLVNSDNISQVQDMVKEDLINIDHLYRYIRDSNGNKAERIV